MDYPTNPALCKDEPTFKANYVNDKSAYGNKSAGKPVELIKPSQEDKV